jgi:hypothetical protein
VQGLLGLHAGGRVGDLGRGLLALGLEVGDEALQRVLAAVEEIAIRGALATREVGLNVLSRHGRFDSGAGSPRWLEPAISWPEAFSGAVKLVTPRPDWRQN